jgi:hypothetical protein
MNMNPDAFENDLRALQRRELPAAWRDEILSAAKTVKPAPRTPRWLVAAWSAAWAAILVMYFTTPAEPDTETRSARLSQVLRFDERAALIDALLASN